ncbi:MAG: citrate synthase [Kiritimatiellia bacterium]
MDMARLHAYADRIREGGLIDPALYVKYNVKRGLRNADGTGVLVGLTRIGSVHGYMISESERISVPGRLFYRGVDVKDLVAGCESDGRFGYEECAYLLIFGELPDRGELAEWEHTLDAFRSLPEAFTQNAILRVPGADIMNSLARAVLAAFLYDPDPDDTSLPNVARQCIELVARFPVIAAYAYQAMVHSHRGKPLLLREPMPGRSTAENLLYLAKESGEFTRLDAELLDLCLILHAEHGGGNNSAFATHVMTSAFTDTYSTIAAATLSLRGPRHGGANLRALDQMNALKTAVADWTDEAAITEYLGDILAQRVGESRHGLIYGFGHAVYTLSDPRAEILREKARDLAKAKGREEEFALYERVERIVPAVINSRRATPRPICANVDFYSGFVYDMLGLPRELFTPIFAVARVIGWCAHRLEELVNGGPIIRPAYKAVGQNFPYVSLDERRSGVSADAKKIP